MPDSPEYCPTCVRAFFYLGTLPYLSDRFVFRAVIYLSRKRRSYTTLKCGGVRITLSRLRYTLVSVFRVSPCLPPCTF